MFIKTKPNDLQFRRAKNHQSTIFSLFSFYGCRDFFFPSSAKQWQCDFGYPELYSFSPKKSADGVARPVLPKRWKLSSLESLMKSFKCIERDQHFDWHDTTDIELNWTVSFCELCEESSCWAFVVSCERFAAAHLLVLWNVRHRSMAMNYRFVHCHHFLAHQTEADCTYTLIQWQCHETGL